MARVNQRTIIELSIEEKNILDDLLADLYDIYDEDVQIGEVMSDIFNASSSKERCHGSRADIIIYK